MVKQAKDAVRKFNEDSAAAAAVEASVKLKKDMPKKPAHKPNASRAMPSRPSSSAMTSRPDSSKPSRPIPHAAPASTKSSTHSPKSSAAPTKSSAPPPKSSAAPAKSSTPVHLATCQSTTGISIASGALASSSAAPKSSSGPTLLKTKAMLVEVLGQVRGRNRLPSKCHLTMKLMMMNLDKSSETDKKGLLEPKAQMCHYFWIQGRSSITLISGTRTQALLCLIFI